MLKNDQLDKAVERRLESDSRSYEDFVSRLTAWENQREGQYFREVVIGEKFSDQHERKDRIVNDSVRVTKNLIANILEIISGDFDNEKVVLYEVNYIDGDYLKFKTDTVRRYAKRALTRHYNYLSDQHDEVTRERVDRAVDQVIGESMTIRDGIFLPEYYRTWLREHRREGSIE